MYEIQTQEQIQDLDFTDRQTSLCSQTEYTKYQTELTKENRLGIIMNAELTLNLNTENTT